MANANDISDVQTQGVGGSTTGSPQVLPIRGEKRILPIPVNPPTLIPQFEQAYNHSSSNLGSPQDEGYYPTGRTQLIEYQDFYVRAALKPFVDYVTIRILNRGQSATGTPDPTTNAIYRFLINPSQVQISRATLDAQSFARSGWQFGIWGEDAVHVTLTGKTAGQYWSFGITDRYQQYSQSYRNLEQLQVVFENNGYWFEGEQAASGPLSADFARRRIKMHQDVELTVGNFVWSGMFESLEISQNADTPFLVDFTLAFTAWKERYRSSSPYPLQIANNTQRGNSYSAYAATQSATATSPGTAQATAQQPPSATPVGLATPATPNVNSNSPAVNSFFTGINLFPVSPNVSDATPTQVPLAPTIGGGSFSIVTGTTGGK
jgi:hypothetical protein